MTEIYNIMAYTLISFFIAWIWVDYYRMIQIYDKTNLGFLSLAFTMGCFSVLFVWGTEFLFLEQYHLELNGRLLHDFSYSVFKIGLVEEIAKILPFILLILLFPKKFKEPIDYLAIMCISALGFSAVENVFYFSNEGPSLINGRAILCSVGHMFDSALIAYGVILYRFKLSKSKPLIPVLFFIFAVLSHGFYDFWLISPYVGIIGILITVIYFLFTISIFAIILNNALNNSSSFTYNKVINSDKIALRLLGYYGMLFILQLGMVAIYDNITAAVHNFSTSILTTGIIVFITCVRLSRFQLIKNRWHPIKIELPFSVISRDPYSHDKNFFSLSIKGASYNELKINKFFNKEVILSPLSLEYESVNNQLKASFLKKYFFDIDQSYFLIKVYQNEDESGGVEMLLKPKLSGTTSTSKGNPIAALLRIDHLNNIDNPKLGLQHFQFVKWVVIHPLEQMDGNFTPLF